MKGQIRKAISEYEKLVADDSRNIRIRTKLADLYARSNDIDRAVEEYVQLAKQYEEEDLNYRAISMYKKVLTVRPKMIDVHYWLADLYKKESLFGNARVLYQNIIRLNPEDQVARGAIQNIDKVVTGTHPVEAEGEIPSLGQPDSEDPVPSDRQPHLDEPLKRDEILDIDEPSSEKVLGEEEIFELEEPIEVPQENREPPGTNLQKTESELYLTHQKVEITQDVSPEKDLESHYHLGIGYMEMGLIDEAIVEFEAALGYSPKKVDCLVMLGQCYTEKGVFERSIFYLEKALQLDGLREEENIRINKQLAKVYEACGMKEKAGQAFKRAGRESNPER
ncbi:MAG: tetratricopeptide repeat protein [Proteobacteria bacterium]|nr:tetratricopeptide repeat protein [Pseudomonadota bacterium]NIS69459.1 tetratricopeptide repeat protein [Pseudomonadota bacterium]